MNPRAAVNDLHPFQGCPFGQLGYFSELKQYMIIDLVDNGESGIRTHAPLRTNGFQDRLVMTTSISLQFSVRYLTSARIIIHIPHCFVNKFFLFFYIFFTFFHLIILQGYICIYFLYVNAQITNLSTKKRVCDHQIFRCGNLYIIVTSFI